MQLFMMMDTMLMISRTMMQKMMNPDAPMQPRVGPLNPKLCNLPKSTLEMLRSSDLQDDRAGKTSSAAKLRGYDWPERARRTAHV